jgi:hypothetical protein
MPLPEKFATTISLMDTDPEACLVYMLDTFFAPHETLDPELVTAAKDIVMKTSNNVPLLLEKINSGTLLDSVFVIAVMKYMVQTEKFTARDSEAFNTFHKRYGQLIIKSSYGKVE